MDKLIVDGTGRHNMGYDEDCIELEGGHDIVRLQDLLPECVSDRDGWTSPLIRFKITVEVEVLEPATKLPPMPRSMVGSLSTIPKMLPLDNAPGPC